MEPRIPEKFILIFASVFEVYISKFWDSLKKTKLNKTYGGAGWDPKLNIVSTRSPNNSAFIRSSPVSPLEGLVMLQWMQAYQTPSLSRQRT